MKYEVATEQLLEGISEQDARRCLILSHHPQLPGQWMVESGDGGHGYRAVFECIGSYLEVQPLFLGDLLQAAESEGYRVIFEEDPAPTLAWISELEGPVGVSLNSDMEGTSEGLLPFQRRAVNFCKHHPFVMLNAGTGTGKAPMSYSLLKWHREQGNFDICLYVCKNHNRLNVQRALSRFADIEGILLPRTPKQRQKVIEGALSASQPTIIMNYEAFRTEIERLADLVEDRKLFLVLDESSAKLKNRTTQMYRGATNMLYTSFEIDGDKYTPVPDHDQRRPKETRVLEMTATPIETNPDNLYNQITLMDPRVYGKPEDFYREFTRGMDRFDRPIWIKHKLDLIGVKAAPLIYRIDKKNPEIASQFPEVLPPEILPLEMSPKERRIYDALEDEYKRMGDDAAMLDQKDILSAIAAFQLICSNPESVLESAARRLNFLDARREYARTQPGLKALKDFERKYKMGNDVALRLVKKLGVEAFEGIDPIKTEALRDLVEDEHKSVVFSRFNNTVLPRLSAYLTEWGLDHVVYHGELSDKQKQAAQDRFKNDDNCRAFLSSDSGSDSIDLEESALVVHYDLPDTWARLTQRQDRIHRIISKHPTVRFVTLLCERTVEGRTLKRISMREGYDKTIIRREGGETEKLSKSDYLYIAFGIE